MEKRSKKGKITSEVGKENPEGRKGKEDEMWSARGSLQCRAFLCLRASFPSLVSDASPWTPWTSGAQRPRKAEWR